MKPTSFFVAAALAGAAAFSFDTREAHACSVLGVPDLVIVSADDGSVPADAPIVVKKTGMVRRGTLRFEATRDDGTDVALVAVPGDVEGVSWLEPADGSALPTGGLDLVAHFEIEGDDGEQTVTKSLGVRGSIADYRLDVRDAAIHSNIVPVPKSPVIRCEHAPLVDSCGPTNDTVSEIAARWRRVPVMTITSDDPGWATGLFERTQRWTVRHADGSIEEKVTETGAGVAFDTSGVEYCVEVTMTPRPGIAADARTDRACVEDAGTRFDWTDAENDATIAEAARNLGCERLEAPPGEELPEAVADRAGDADGAEAGCSVGGARPSRACGFGGAGFATTLALVIAATRRRSRR